MDRLTREEIVAAWNGAVPESKDKGIEMYLHLMQAVADAQYRKCERSAFSQEAVRDAALEMAEKRVVEAAIDEIQGSCTITCHNLQNAVMTLLAVRKKS